ncbi:MAG TPA: DUF1440 domain-containing protein [Bryobacteraceae bacterium]|nr:DUF1440 domain-containing protein [Bryobacteraceae bacterium]
MFYRSSKNKLFKGLIAGALGGLAASWTMTQFQVRLSRALGQSHPHGDEEEDATEKTAQMVSSALLHHELSGDEKKAAAPVVHYAYGTGIGVLYGGLVQKQAAATSGFGTGYGAAIWAIGDEIAVPLLGLSKKASETPVSQHLQYLAAHLVYGVTLEGVRRLALKML